MILKWRVQGEDNARFCGYDRFQWHGIPSCPPVRLLFPLYSYDCILTHFNLFPGNFSRASCFPVRRSKSTDSCWNLRRDMLWIIPRFLRMPIRPMSWRIRSSCWMSTSTTRKLRGRWPLRTSSRTTVGSTTAKTFQRTCSRVFSRTLPLMNWRWRRKITSSFSPEVCFSPFGQ